MKIMDPRTGLEVEVLVDDPEEWTSESPTPYLRWSSPDIRLRVLQQEWIVTVSRHGLPNVTREWRDIPIEGKYVVSGGD